MGRLADTWRFVSPQVSWLDVTAAGVLGQVATLCASEGIQLFIAAANSQVTSLLVKSGLHDTIEDEGNGSGGFFSSVHIAVKRAAAVAANAKKQS